MKNLTGFFKRIQCVSSLSKVGIDIRPMNQHQVDIIRLQVFEGIVTLLNDFVIVSVTNIRPISHVEISALCCHYDPLARSALLERLPHQTFGCTGIIGRGGINKIDTIFHCGADRINTGLFRIVIPARSADPPGSQRHLGHLHPGLSKLLIPHVHSTFLRLSTSIRPEASAVNKNRTPGRRTVSAPRSVLLFFQTHVAFAPN